MAGFSDMSPQEMDAYMQSMMGDMQNMINAGMDGGAKAVKAQLQDAQKARENQMAIARLQGEISKYGINAQRATAMAQLKENARQFDMSHALEIKKFKLQYAQTATEYMSSPDRFAQARDFIDMASRVTSDQGGPKPYGQTSDFRGNTEADFAVLAEGGAPRASTGPSSGSADGIRAEGGAPVAAASAPVAMPAGGGGAGAGAGAATGGGGGASAPDPRVAAITAMYKNLPPSRGDGLEASDFAVLNASRELMSTPLRPGSIERMRPDQRAIYSSYVKKSGRSWNDYMADYTRSGVGQGSVRAAG